MTSADLAACMGTNAVVVRRTMAGLREAGWVRSEKGHGGGWEIACDLSTVTLKDIYDALGSPRLLAMGVHLENPSCLVEQAVNRSLSDANQGVSISTPAHSRSARTPTSGTSTSR